MPPMTETDWREPLERHGQSQVLRYWDELSEVQQRHLQAQIAQVKFELVERLSKKWILSAPPQRKAAAIEPVSAIPVAAPDRPGAREAWEMGEKALADGRVGLVLVAGGQGTRLGFDGPKGTFPIGPVSGRTLFEYHADKIKNVRRRYGCALPWYIMLGETTEEDTKAFFRSHDFFGLGEETIAFFKQGMMPCVDEKGKFILDTKATLAMNPDGHGGCIPAMFDQGILRDARERGIDTLSYFQVDNWAVKVADPFFIGYHLLRDGEFSSKVKPKTEPHEPAGVFCRCDGKVRVIEYTELDTYPQLLDTDAEDRLIHYAANAAIHVFSVDFIEGVYRNFAEFPWHCSHKKIPFIDERGERIQPDSPNGYKFETFVFDALAFARHEPVMLEIEVQGEFTPTKQMTGPDSVEEARVSMTKYWRGWLEAAGCTTPLEDAQIEINPEFAISKEEFVEKAQSLPWPDSGDVVIGPDGSFL